MAVTQVKSGPGQWHSTVTSMQGWHSDRPHAVLLNPAVLMSVHGPSRVPRVEPKHNCMQGEVPWIEGCLGSRPHRVTLDMR